MGHSAREQRWLRIGQNLLDGRAVRPVFPYSSYRPIECANDCREAVLDETHAVEEEFGQDAVEPFYQLLWHFNRHLDVMTTHAVFRKNEAVPRSEDGGEYSWATDCVGVRLNLFGVSEADRLSAEANRHFAQWFHKALHENAQDRSPNSKGWYMHIWPEVVDYQTVGGEEILAYGVDLKMVAYAGTRRRACDRWTALVGFVDEVVEKILDEGTSA